MHNQVNNAIKNEQDRFIELTKQIWGLAEIAYEEDRSAALLGEYLSSKGFSVEMGVAGLPTAFKASFGTGKIKIGILAEYDALPKLSQSASPIFDGGTANGHGCGHNLLGVASVAAGVALKEIIQKNGLDATVIVYGCPAEEVLSGKVKMIEGGCFTELDAAICWHPYDRNLSGETSYQALDSMTFTFHGKTAHAAGDPENGRSALDACELMSVGANYLREHISADVKIHYSYLSAGEKPNIVADFAKVWYFVRAKNRKNVDETVARVKDIAIGAAYMSGTQMEYETLCSGAETNVSMAMCRLVYDCMNKVEKPSYDEADTAFAKALAASINPEKMNGSINTEIPVPTGVVSFVGGSTDVSDVSQIVPTANFAVTCYPSGTPGHHWGITASSGSPIGHKGMLYAARIMALIGAELATDPSKLAEVKAEFAVKKKS